jgi:secondary thiamine-phosphate synthase enzyme
MHAFSESFTVRTRGKGTHEITRQVAEIIRRGGLREGLATVFIQHTSASLIIYENADHSARVDLEAFFQRLVPEDADYFTHTAEGPDDMPSHLRMVLTRTSETVPVRAGELQLGTWQGIFLFEHRDAAHTRTLVVSGVGV